MPPARALLLVALLALAAPVSVVSAPTRVFTDAFAPAWSGAGYAPTSGAFNFSAAWARRDTRRAPRSEPS